MDLTPTILEGDIVRLEPLAPVHIDALTTAGADPSVFRWTQLPDMRWTYEQGCLEAPTRALVAGYVEQAQSWQKAGTALPFATVVKQAGHAVGSTRFANIDVANKRAEIGWTWLASDWQRSGANTEAKYLMLRHAFERMGCIRVEFKTDRRNDKSRAALLRIGAIQEGILRQHFVLSDGTYRDSVYFSVLDNEWPRVKSELEAKLKRK
ncbi:MAG: GNAT family protein [Rhodospirillales bacterium]